MDFFPVVASAEDFRCLLEKGKSFVLHIKKSGSTLSDDELTFVYKLFLASRNSYDLARKGIIDESEYQEMTMVVLFANLGALFDIECTRESLRTSIFKRKDTMMELFLPPNETFGSDLLHYSGKGIFRLSTILKQTPVLPDRYGKVPCERLDRRWEVPLVYVICRMVYDVFMKQRFATTLQCILRKVDQIMSKLPHIISSQKAGVGLFLLDLFVSKGVLPEGLTLDFLIEKLVHNCCYCLKVAASGSALSVDDLRALCVERLLQHDDSNNDKVLAACSKLYRGFNAEAYIKQLHKCASNEEPPAPSSSHLRNRLLDPAYVLHTYMGYLLMKDDVFHAVSLAAKVEKQNILPFETQVKLYKQVFDYHLQEGTLFYHCQGNWIKQSHAVNYVPLAGRLGIEVLVNHLHRLEDEFPAKHFSLQERQYISLASHQTVLWILRLKYGPRHGLHEFSSRKYWKAMPVLSPEKLEDWARDFLEQESPIPETIEKIIGEKGKIHPDLSTLAARTKFEPIAIDQFSAGTTTGVQEGITFDEEQRTDQQLIDVDVEEIDSSKEEEARDDRDMEVDQDEGFAKEEYVWGQSGDDKAMDLNDISSGVPETRGLDVEPEVKADYSQVERPKEQENTKDQLDAFDASRDDGEVDVSVGEYHASDKSSSVEQDGTDGESSTGEVEVVEDYHQRTPSSVGEGEVVEVDQQTPPRRLETEYGDDDESSQVEQGYDAGESQPEEEEQQPTPLYLDGAVMQETSGSPDETENRQLLPAKRVGDEAFPSSGPNAPIASLSTGGPVVPEAFSEPDPGYEAEDSQCPTDLEEIIRPQKKPRLESGYDAGESQGHTEDEDDEEMQTEEEKEELQEQAHVDLATSMSQQKIPNSKIERSLNSTLSDMSAADERTTGFDDDVAENSELEDLGKRKEEVVPALQIMPSTAEVENAPASLLVRFASAVQREDETLRASLKQSPASGEQTNDFATDMSVAGSASRGASIESEENDDNLPLESAEHIVDHVPEHPLGTQDPQLRNVQANDQQAVDKEAAAAAVVHEDNGSKPSAVLAGGNDGTRDETIGPEDKKNGEKSKLESDAVVVDHVPKGSESVQESVLPQLPPSDAQSTERDHEGTPKRINADARVEERQVVLAEDQEKRADGAGDNGAEDIVDAESWHTGAQEPPKTPPRQSLASTGTQTGKDVDFSSPQSRTSDITAHSPSTEQGSGRPATPPVSLRSSGSKRSRIVWGNDEESSDEDHISGVENRSEARPPKRYKEGKLEAIDEEPDENAEDATMDASKTSVESSDKRNFVDSRDKGGAVEASATTSVVAAGKPPLPPARKSLARKKDGEGKQDTESGKKTLSREEESITDVTRSTRRSTRKTSEEEEADEETATAHQSTPSRKGKSAKDDESVASATRSTRRSTRNKTAVSEDEDKVEDESTTVRRSTLSRKAKAAKDDESVASATRSTRKSTRNKSVAEEKEPSTVRRSTPSRKAKSAKDDESVSSATRSARRSTRNKSVSIEEEEGVEEEPSTVRRSTPSHKAKSAEVDESVASAARSTRRSTRNKLTEEAEEKEEEMEEETTAARRSTPLRKEKSAKDDESIASVTQSTRRSTRSRSAAKEVEDEIEDEPTTVRRSTPSRKAKTAKDDESVASATRSTRRSARSRLAGKEEEEEVDEEATMVRRSMPSRKTKSAKDDESVVSAARSTRRSTRTKLAEKQEKEESDKEATTIRRSTLLIRKSVNDDESVASSAGSRRRSTRNQSKDEAVGVSRSTRTRKAASTDETSVSSTTRSTRKANDTTSVSTRSSRRTKK